ncbi:MAG: PD-(D/E)XK nuclease family protein [Actinomycetota bacterium]|nr:PD-(D/E)XK nuclease family protein [Actinomycetota bacterium]
MSTVAIELNPAQQRVRDALGSGGSELPEFDANLGDRLRAQLEMELSSVVDELGPDEDLMVSKHLLSQVHSCEARMLAEDDGAFDVTVPIARGSVAHKAIELAIHWKGEAVPLDLVDEALARLTESDHWLADWLRTCGDTNRAELRSEAGDRVSKFLECFPPLRARWRPVTESRLIVDVCSGRIRLQGKVDLTIGVADGRRAGKVIVDLKSGGASTLHRDDLRFYALLETIRIGVPPRLVASYYLDQGVAHTEAVTVGLLDAALARTVDGARRIVDLRNGTVAPVKRAAVSCRWCRILAGCTEGQAHLRSPDDLASLDTTPG